MAITFNEGQTQLEFGYGDIEVCPALLQQDEVVGAVCFFQSQSPTPIGTKGIHEPNLVVELEHTPVRMEFNRIASIDVVIRALEEAKALMINAQSAIESTEQPNEVEAV